MMMQALILTITHYGMLFLGIFVAIYAFIRCVQEEWAQWQWDREFSARVQAQQGGHDDAAR